MCHRGDPGLYDLVGYTIRMIVLLRCLTNNIVTDDDLQLIETEIKLKHFYRSSLDT
jgi:hypothetical protein